MRLLDACNVSPVSRAFRMLTQVALVDNYFVHVSASSGLETARVSDIDIYRYSELTDWEPVTLVNTTVADGKPSHSLNALRDEVHELANEKGWHGHYDAAMVAGEYPDVVAKMHIATCLANIHGEVSEALECLRATHEVNWLQDLMATELIDDHGKPVGFAIELADVLIRVLDLCGLLEIDIDDAVRRKHEYNKTRPYRHGGKAL